MKWDRWTQITVYGAFIQVWIFIIAITAISVEAARVVNSCSDSDGGIVPSVFGAVSGYYKNKPYFNSDYCVSSEVVMEYYCTDKYKSSVQQNCGTDGYIGNNYCLNGDVYRNYVDYYCANGACGSNITQILQQDCLYGCINGTCSLPPSDSCSDSDGGVNVWTRGTVSGVYNGNQYSYTDICINNWTLSEWYCVGNYAYNIGNYTCTGNFTACLNGACV
ncbi:MAG: hypothetical protein QXN71_02320 [Candidatus Aenigmatarchaeota archaeon]